MILVQVLGVLMSQFVDNDVAKIQLHRIVFVIYGFLCYFFENGHR